MSKYEKIGLSFLMYGYFTAAIAVQNQSSIMSALGIAMIFIGSAMFLVLE